MITINDEIIEYAEFMNNRNEFLDQIDQLRKKFITMEQFARRASNGLFFAYFFKNLTDLELAQVMFLLNKSQAREQSEKTEKIKNFFKELLEQFDGEKING